MTLCSENITPEQLSVYQSRPHDSVATAELAIHIENCPSCQQTLQQYDQIAQTLRRQPNPIDGGQLWQYLQSSIIPERGFFMNRRLYISASIILAALVVIAFSFIIIRSQHATIPPKATATATLTPTATIAVLHPDPAQGWVAAIPYGKAIAFANDQPLTGYVCGNTNTLVGTGQKNSTTAIEYGITHDGGRTWSGPQTLTDAYGASCSIFINPNDATDVIIESRSCWTTTANCSDFTNLYRSRDGGKTWAQLSVPTTIEYVYLYSPIWNGHDLFVQVGQFLGVSNLVILDHHIAVSRNGGSFEWINDASFPASEVITDVTVWHSILYVRFDKTDGVYSSTILSTSDGGQHWSSVQYPCPGIHMSIAADGKTLICSTQGTQAISKDDGKTWKDTLYYVQVSTPDGTLYGNNGADASQASDAIAKQTSDSSSWTVILHLSVPARLLAASAAEQGHPLAIWRIDDTSKPGISYHAA
jgi:hypothetical protein